MAYRRSAYRVDFEKRIESLLEESKKAHRLTNNLGDKKLAAVRDMVFQCAIFQTSAALETYLKLILESWSQAIRVNAMGGCVPIEVRALFARKRLNPHFRKFAFHEEENALHKSITGESDLWSFLMGGQQLPSFLMAKLFMKLALIPHIKI